MKKRIAAALLAAFTVFTLSACGGKDDVASVSTEGSPVRTGIIELGEYKGLEVTVEKTEIPEELLDEYVKQFYAEAAKEFTWNKTAEEGDTVIFDFVGTIDGVAFDGGSADDYILVLGSHAFIDGFEDGMIGMTEGEERVLDLTFPEDYHSADLAGKACQFTVNVDHIIPPLSDETIKTLQSENYSTKDEFIKATEDVLDAYYNADYETNVMTELLEQIISTTVWGELPKDELEKQRQYVTESYAQAASEAGLDVPSYLATYGTNVDVIAEMFVKRDLIFAAVAERENLTVTDEELDAYVQEMLDEYYNDGTTVEDIYATGGKDDFRDYVVTQNVYDFLIANAKVNTVPAQ